MYFSGDSYGLSLNRGYSFSTHDRDNSNNCPQIVRGGWWYASCAYANLNGEYITPGTTHSGKRGEAGMVYYNFEYWFSLKTSKMMFRRVIE